MILVIIRPKGLMTPKITKKRRPQVKDSPWNGVNQRILYIFPYEICYNYRTRWNRSFKKLKHSFEAILGPGSRKLIKESGNSKD